jgi:hypothetical protein
MLKPLFIALFLCAMHVVAQQPQGLVAQYSFNKGNIQSDMGPNEVKMIGATLADDRFGSSAWFLHGSPGSYINLGTDPALKQATGTISIWIKQANIMYSGRGFMGNPIITTKMHAGDDFNEAYSLGIEMYERRLNATSHHVIPGDTLQVNAWSGMPIKLGRWYHVVMCYDDSFLSLYIDGKLQNRLAKNFHTVFLPSDSVMIGFNKSPKSNLRFFNGTVDDIEFYNRVLTAEEVISLYNAPDPNRTHAFFKWGFTLLLVLVSVSVIVWVLVKRYKRELAKEIERRRLQQNMHEMEIRLMKVQMNPHFIFNALNSLKHVILQGETEKARQYLDKFSVLLRRTLESNKKEYIALEEEIDILTKYIELEALRFGKAFNYEITADTTAIAGRIRIPQMLIQPVVENAIWHGLLPKQGDRTLHVAFSFFDDQTLCCIVEDNGVGRQHKPIINVHKEKSLGISFITQRLSLMQKERGGSYSIHIEDKAETGTRVRILMPAINHE